MRACDWSPGRGLLFIFCRLCGETPQASSYGGNVSYRQEVVAMADSSAQFTKNSIALQMCLRNRAGKHDSINSETFWYIPSAHPASLLTSDKESTSRQIVHEILTNVPKSAVGSINV